MVAELVYVWGECFHALIYMAKIYVEGEGGSYSVVPVVSKWYICRVMSEGHNGPENVQECMQWRAEAEQKSVQVFGWEEIFSRMTEIVKM